MFFLLLTRGGESSIWYVRAGAISDNSGTSWNNAISDLQDALTLAQAGDEVWVAKGTYKPDSGTGDRSRFFQLPCGVALYGGFAGWEECLDERDLSVNETMLSGDLDDNDGPWNCDEVSNCCTDHEGWGCEDPTCEALVCSHDPLCCDPENPDPTYWGDHCAPLAWTACCHLGTWGTCDDSYRVLAVTNCDEETILSGVTIVGGYHSWVSDPDVPFASNAGVATESAKLAIVDCKFTTTDTDGLFANSGSHIEITDSLIQRDLIVFGLSDMVVERSLFIGAHLSVEGSMILRDSVFREYLSGATVYGDAMVDNCSFQNGNGLSLDAGEQEVRESIFLNNAPALSIQDSSATIDDCVFLGNSPVGGGGASALFRNCVFANNERMALRWSFGNLYVLNCTIVDNGFELNPVGVFGAGIELQTEAAAQVLNSIIWGNGIPSNNQNREEDQLGVREDFGNSLEIDYSIVEGWTGRFGGDGNFSADPRLVNVNGLDGEPGTIDDDVRLLPSSPAIGAGLSTSPYLLSPDLDGHPRILCGSIDMGAYEFGIGDRDCDGHVTQQDALFFANCISGPALPYGLEKGCQAFDFDGDDDVDFRDLAMLSRQFVK